MRNAFLIAAVLPLVLSGCVVGTVAKTVVDVVTLPVKVASAGVDAVTTSQAEADQKRGRELRTEDGVNVTPEQIAEFRAAMAAAMDHRELDDEGADD